MKPLFIITLSLCFASCIQPYRDDYSKVGKHRSGTVMLFLGDTSPSLRATMTTTRNSTHSNYFHMDSRIVFKDYDLTIHPYDGLHVQGPATDYFINIIGALHVELLDSTKLKVESSIGEAMLDITNPDTIKPVYFLI